MDFWLLLLASRWVIIREGAIWLAKRGKFSHTIQKHTIQKDVDSLRIFASVAVNEFRLGFIFTNQF
ncbi:MAG: hypothetical protein NZ901_11175 [Geminocystis sp.]|nr:hypothetical protein [Geminocystis sp.]HIK38362.1 hypothetical protein [Geminocystis sp. M7585_C2015_104]MCS7148733.1 hypothetical protein [Geminocystis sp.]MCX8078393.1 hypothetical protein [Geminocystis sp.]MDW8116118.1 hypothetical protein [Geminocystis sp.]